MTKGKRIIQKKLVNQTKGQAIREPCDDDTLRKQELDVGYLGLTRWEETLQLVWKRLRRNSSILEKKKKKKPRPPSSVSFIFTELGLPRV